MHKQPLLNPAALDRLTQIGGRKVVREMAGVFTRNMGVRLAEARTGLREGRREPVERVAHSLKTSCAHIGADAMRETALQIEAAARAGETALLPELLDRLESGYGDLLPELQALLQNTRQIRVAVIEDNADNRILVRAILDGNYDVVDYESGPLALEDFRRTRPDLVLLDISLPGMDGVEVLRRIRNDPDLSAIPVIALTAHAMAGDREKYLQHGFNAYITKPILDESALIGEIAAQLEARPR